MEIYIVSFEDNNSNTFAVLGAYATQEDAVRRAEEHLASYAGVHEAKWINEMGEYTWTSTGTSIYHTVEKVVVQ